MNNVFFSFLKFVVYFSTITNFKRKLFIAYAITMLLFVVSPHAKSSSQTLQPSPSMPVIHNTSDHHSPHRSTSPGAHGSAHTSPRAATSAHTSPRAVNSTHMSPRAAALTQHSQRHTRGSTEVSMHQFHLKIL